jgi:hypothetical protein
MLEHQPGLIILALTSFKIDLNFALGPALTKIPLISSSVRFSSAKPSISSSEIKTRTLQCK